MADDNPYCEKFLGDVISALIAGEQSQDPYVIAMQRYSGLGWQDQGDPTSCLNTESMIFVELQANLGYILYKGLCVKDSCTAGWLNDHRQQLVQFIDTTLQMQLTEDSLQFYAYPNEYPPTDNSDFIIFSIVCAIILSLTLASFIFNLFSNKSTQFKKDHITIKQNIEKNESTNSVLKEKLISRNSVTNNQQQSEKYNRLIDEKSNKNELQQQSLLYKVIDCWNVKKNTQKLFELNSRNSDLQSFDSIRVVSFIQVVFGHAYLNCASYFVNLTDFQQLNANAFIILVFGCFYSVDIFFLLGGFFLAYVTCDNKNLRHFQYKSRSNNALKITINFLLGVLNRVLRILPSYLFAIFFLLEFADYFGSSPTWQQFYVFSGLCSEEKWKKLLFIDNLYTNISACLPQSWYLPNDIQMFICSLLFLVVYANSKKIGKYLILLAIIVFQFVSIYLSYDYNLTMLYSINVMQNPNWYSYYYKPWTRCPPYFIGLIFGILYREYKTQQTQTKANNNNDNNEESNTIIHKIAFVFRETYWKWVLYFIGFFNIFFITYYPRVLQVYGADYISEGKQNFWFGISRSWYSLSVLCVVLPGMCGSRDLLVRSMSSKIFQLFAKITFQGYLFHYTFLQYTLWNISDALYLNNENILTVFITEFVIVIFFSFILNIIIEAPFNNLANLIFSKSTPPPNSSKSASNKSQKDQEQSQPFSQTVPVQNTIGSSTTSKSQLESIIKVN